MNPLHRLCAGGSAHERGQKVLIVAAVAVFGVIFVGEGKALLRQCAAIALGVDGHRVKQGAVQIHRDEMFHCQPSRFQVSRSFATITSPA